MTKPLEGLKVIELGQLIAGPFAGKCFAEFGAEVIKVEPPEGDPLRKWRKLHQGTSLWWYVQNRNKKSVTVDLRLPEGQEVVRRILRDADVAMQCAQSWSKIGVPVSRVISRNRAMMRPVIGPDFPFPIGRPSTLTTGMISAAVPVRKHSSATKTSCRVISAFNVLKPSSAAISNTTERVMPRRAPAATGGVTI